MARFGISGIIEMKEKKVHVITKQKVKGHQVPLWVGNITFNFKKEGQQLISGKMTIYDYLQSMYRSNSIVIKESVGFISNGNPVILSKLYPGHEKYYTCFIRNGYNLYLLTLGSKTIHEFRVAGYDSFLKSRVPFTLTITQNESGRKEFMAVNLKPCIRVDEMYSHEPKPKEESNGNSAEERN